MTRAARADLSHELGDLLDTAPCGFVSFTDDGTIVLANATLHAMLGYGAGELAGRPFETLLTVGARIFHQTHFFPLVRLHGHAEEIFVLLRTKAGAEMGVLVNAVRRPRGGEQHTDCVLVEVRERRKFEDELLRARRAADQARAEATERARALEVANETLEQQAMELELQQQQMEQQAAELEAAGADLQALNNDLVARSAELERQRARADDANQAKSQFLTTMSHELRTPLNAIGGYTELVTLGIYGPVNDAQRDALERIARSQRHLLGLVNDVLNLARIEAGRVEYHMETVPLATIVGSVLTMIEPQMDAKGQQCAVEVAPEVTARADREKLEQILINLLTNAVKFTPPGGRIRVDAPRRAGGPDVVFLRVSDTGVGIPRAKLDAVFEPFVQVDMGHTRRNEGTGLGLSISRDLAHGMGGELRARSLPGVGSAFTLALPRAG